MTSLFIWSQILAGIAMLIYIIAMQIRSNKMLRILMFVGGVINGTHFLLLGVPQATIIEYVTGSRWIVSIFTHRNSMKLFFIVSIMGIGLIHADGWVSALPVIGGVLGTLAAFTPNDRNMRVYLIIALILWVVHNILVFSPIAIASSLFFLISMMIGYERFYHHNHVHIYPYQPVHFNTKK